MEDQLGGMQFGSFEEAHKWIVDKQDKHIARLSDLIFQTSRPLPDNHKKTHQSALKFITELKDFETHKADIIKHFKDEMRR